MNKWLFRLYVVLMFLGVMMITAWRTFTPVMLPMGLAIIGLSTFLIMWEYKIKKRYKKDR